jgi:hypothetical protein
MKTYRQFMTEAQYPNWLRAGVAVLVIKMRNLTQQIENETDPTKQNALIAQQNRLLSYISGLGIGVSTEDSALMMRMRKGLK